MGKFKDLIAYQKSFEMSMKIFELTKRFPPEEKYSLASQIRRSTRSVCANIAESYRRRNHIKHFIAKLYDAYTENTETEVWLEFAKACQYISEEDFITLQKTNDEIGRILNFMIANPEKFT